MSSATEESVSVVYRVSEHDTECDTVQAVGVIVYVESGSMCPPPPLTTAVVETTSQLRRTVAETRVNWIQF